MRTAPSASDHIAAVLRHIVRILYQHSINAYVAKGLSEKHHAFKVNPLKGRRHLGESSTRDRLPPSTRHRPLGCVRPPFSRFRAALGETGAVSETCATPAFPFQNNIRVKGWQMSGNLVAQRSPPDSPTGHGADLDLICRHHQVGSRSDCASARASLRTWRRCVLLISVFAITLQEQP